MTEPIAEKPEPLGCTLGDLIALTLGAAVSASLNWHSLSMESMTISGRAVPRWYVPAFQVLELFLMCCVALIPVILARSWRYARSIRPVEYLPILAGLSQVAYSTSKWPIFGLYYKSPGPPYLTLVNKEAQYVWELAQIAIGLVTALLFAIRRRRAIDWLSGFLLAVAWYLLTSKGGYLYQQWANERIVNQAASLWIRALLSAFLVQGPQYLIGWLPLAVPIVAWSRSSMRRPTWVEWAALTLHLSLVVGYEARNQTREILGGQPFDFFRASHLAARVVAFGLSYALARWSEPAWRRLLGANGSEIPESSVGKAVRSIPGSR
jgi:hypothetical protein